MKSKLFTTLSSVIALYSLTAPLNASYMNDANSQPRYTCYNVPGLGEVESYFRSTPYISGGYRFVGAQELTQQNVESLKSDCSHYGVACLTAPTPGGNSHQALLFNSKNYDLIRHSSQDLHSLNMLPFNVGGVSGTQANRYLHAVVKDKTSAEELHVINVHFNKGSKPEDIATALGSFPRYWNWLVLGEINADACLCAPAGAGGIRYVTESSKTRGTYEPQWRIDDNFDKRGFKGFKMEIDQPTTGIISKLSPEPNVKHFRLGSEDTGPFKALNGIRAREESHRWTNASEAVWGFDVDHDPDTFPLLVTFQNVKAFAPRQMTQTVDVVLNDKAISQHQMSDAKGPEAMQIEMPIDLAGTVNMQFNVSSPVAPCDYPEFASGDADKLGLRFSEVQVFSCPRSVISHSFKVGSEETGPFKVAGGIDGSEGEHRWTLGKQAVWEFDMDHVPYLKPIAVVFKDLTVFAPRKMTQNVCVYLNDTIVSEHQLWEGRAPETIRVDLPRDGKGIVKLFFNISTPVKPNSIPELGIPDGRELGILFSEAEVLSYFRK
jgi:hypothetical protein